RGRARPSGMRGESVGGRRRPASERRGSPGGTPHLEAVIADPPRHLLEALGRVPGAQREKAPASSAVPCVIAAHDRGGGSVGEERVRDDEVRLRALLVVKRAELHRDDEDERAGIGTGDAIGGAKGGQASVAAHEADDRPLDGTARTEPLDEEDIETGREKARAGRNDDVCDRLWRYTRSPQGSARRLLREHDALRLVDAHAALRRRERLERRVP